MEPISIVPGETRLPVANRANISLRLPPDIKRRIEQEATDNNLSQQQVMEQLLTKALDQIDNAKKGATSGGDH